jgi:hypothetical protein
MANVVYENFVLENKMSEFLDTSLNVNSYMTIDTSLVQAPGMIKNVNVYDVSGSVEDLSATQGNTSTLEAYFTTVPYEVGVTQGRFVYYDEQEMQDPYIVDVGLKGLSDEMVNDLVAKAIVEWGKATLTYDWDASGNFDFDDAVDAIAELNVEDESGLFFLVSPADKAKVRKGLGDDLKYSEGFARTGYIGSVAGVPVIVTKAVTEGTIFLASKEAVTCFVKEGVEVEQERDANTRKNTVYARKVMLVALTDATKVVEIS